MRHVDRNNVSEVVATSFAESEEKKVSALGFCANCPLMARCGAPGAASRAQAPVNLISQPPHSAATKRAAHVRLACGQHISKVLSEPCYESIFHRAAFPTSPLMISIHPRESIGSGGVPT